MTDPGDTLAELLTCDTEWHAASIVNGLRARGFAAQAEGGYTAGFRAEAPSKARVMVFTRDLLAARLALSEMRTEAGSIDWDAVDVGEHVEGEPQPVGRIGPVPARAEPTDAQQRNRGLLITIAAVAVAVAALAGLRACGAGG